MVYFKVCIAFGACLVALALGGCKKDQPAATGTRTETTTPRGGDDHWGPNCKAYFAAVDEACKPPHDQSSQCKSWTTGIKSMKERPKDDPKNAEAEKMGCKMLLPMVKRVLDERAARR